MPVPGARRAQEIYLKQQAEFQANPSDATAAWQFAWAAFEWAEFATKQPQREKLALEGIAAARVAVERSPDSAAAHYYLAMNLGQLARTRSLGALKLIGEMETEFLKARDLDEQFDYAGPDRNLGTLYLNAPSIGSVGDKTKARAHLERAVKLAPEYPDNHLTLIEAWQKWGDHARAREQWTALQEIWPRARRQLTGENWQAAWADWQQRCRAIERKLGRK